MPTSLSSADLPRIEFYDDRIVIWWADTDHAQPNSLELDLRRIGHVQFVPPGRITIGYGISRPWLKLHTDVTIPRLVAEDRFDQIVTHLETHVPDHLFSTFERSQLRHSLPFKLADVLPWTDPVTHATARVVATDPAQLEYTTEHHKWTVTHDSGFVLRGVRDGEPAGDPVLQVLRSQFFESNGMVLGSMPQFASYAYAVEVGDGDSMIVHEALRTITIAGKRIGTFTGLHGSQEIEFDAEVPEARALLLMLAQTQRQLLPGTPAALVDEPEYPEFSLSTTGARRYWQLIVTGTMLGWCLAAFAFYRLSAPAAIGAFTPLAIAFAVVAYTTLRRVRETVEVFSDRLILWRHHPRLGGRLRLTPWDVGHLTFEKFTALRVWFGVPDVDEKPFVQVHLGSRRIAERDEFMQHLAAMSDTHVCSYEEGDDRVKYSRTWRIDELFPWQQQVKTAWLHADRGDGTRAETASGVYPVMRSKGYALYLPDSSADVLLLHVDDKRIHLHNGMVLGCVQDGRRIRLGSGEDVTLDLQSGEAQLDGELLGRLTNEGHTLRLDLVAPQPELLLLVILLTFAEGTRVN